MKNTKMEVSLPYDIILFHDLVFLLSSFQWLYYKTIIPAAILFYALQAYMDNVDIVTLGNRQ